MTTFLLVSDVAKQLQVGSEQILAYINTGKLRATNVGLGKKRPRWRIDPADLQAFIESRRNRTHSKPQAKRKIKYADVIKFF